MSRPWSRRIYDVPYRGADVLRAFSLLLGIPEEACSGVFIAETPIDAEALHYTDRERLQLIPLELPIHSNFRILTKALDRLETAGSC